MLEYGVVLTGGIASGKSSAVKFLRKKGYAIIDADEIAHQAFELKKKDLQVAFNLASLQEVNRKKIGEIVFADKEKKKILEAILHPIIKEMILDQSLKLEQKKEIYFLDIPLFFEIGGREVYNTWFVVLIFCNEKLQLERLCERNNFNQEEAKQRISAQIPLDKKISLSDYVIDNSKDLEELERNIALFLTHLKHCHKTFRNKKYF